MGFFWLLGFGAAYCAWHHNDKIWCAFFDRVASDIGAGSIALFKDKPEITDDVLERHGAVFDGPAPLPPLDKAS